MRLAPRFASVRARASPMPDEAPVIHQHVPSNISPPAQNGDGQLYAVDRRGQTRLRWLASETRRVSGNAFWMFRAASAAQADAAAARRLPFADDLHRPAAAAVDDPAAVDLVVGSDFERVVLNAVRLDLGGDFLLWRLGATRCWWRRRCSPSCAPRG
jgi:hypothetical protein